MNLFNKFAKGASKFLGFDRAARFDVGRPGYFPRSTTATRRAEREANTKYLHESVSLTKVPDNLVPILGTPYITLGKGTSYTTRNGAAKREADRMADMFGFSNKLRRKLRAAVRTRMAELA